MGKRSKSLTFWLNGYSRDRRVAREGDTNIVKIEPYFKLLVPCLVCQYDYDISVTKWLNRWNTLGSTLMLRTRAPFETLSCNASD